MDDSFNFRSRETHEVLDKMPSWMIRWGTIFFFLFFVAILSVLSFFKMSSKVKGVMVTESVEVVGLDGEREQKIAGDLNLDIMYWGLVKEGQKVFVSFHNELLRKNDRLSAVVQKVVKPKQFDENFKVNILVSSEDLHFEKALNDVYLDGMKADVEVVIESKRIYEKVNLF